MTTAEKIDRLLDILQALPSGDGLMNPYASDSGPAAADAGSEIGAESDALRSRNLRAFLARAVECGSDTLLCGEAPGYQGCRFTGLAFTAEADIAGRSHPVLADLEILPDAALGRRRVMREPSGQAVWQAMRRAMVVAVPWNAVPLHPHEPGSALTNRTPTRSEVALGQAALLAMVDVITPTRIVAVGRTAERALGDLGIEAAAVRHPAYGGKPEFLQGLEDLGVIGPAPPSPQQSLF